MDIRKSYYDPEMVKNLSVMLRLSPEEVINKLWSNRVPTTITKAMTTEEMLAKNPDAVRAELDEPADREAAAESPAKPKASRLPWTSPSKGKYFNIKEDSWMDLDPPSPQVANALSGVSKQAKLLAKWPDQEFPEERMERSFYPENVARAFAGNPYVGQEFDPATLAGLSRLTGMSVEEVAFKLSKSNDDEPAGNILARREAAAEGLGEGKSPLTRRLEGMARNVGPSQHGRQPVIDEPAGNILARREAAAEGLGEGKSPLTRRLEGMARNVGPSQHARDPDETTNPAENTSERPATNSFDPGTREGKLNRKSTEIDGTEYQMNDAAAAAMESARAQGRTLDPSQMQSIQDKPNKLNSYVNRQGVRPDARNLTVPKPTNTLPNRAPERDNLNLSLVDVFYGHIMSKSKKKINRG